MCHESCMPSWLPGVPLQDITCMCGCGYFTFDTPPKWIGGDLVRQKLQPTKQQYYGSVKRWRPEHEWQKSVCDTDDRKCPASKNGENFSRETLDLLAKRAGDLYTTHKNARASHPYGQTYPQAKYGQLSPPISTSKKPIQQFLPSEGLDMKVVAEYLAEVSGETPQVHRHQHKGRDGLLVVASFQLSQDMIAEMKRRTSDLQSAKSYQAYYGNPRLSQHGIEEAYSSTAYAVSSPSQYTTSYGSYGFSPPSHARQSIMGHSTPRSELHSYTSELEEDFSALGFGQGSYGQEGGGEEHSTVSQRGLEPYETKETPQSSRVGDNDDHQPSRKERKPPRYYRRR